MAEKHKLHPYVPEMREMYRQGKITRKEFIRMAALLGVSMSAMPVLLSGCAPKTEPTPVQQAPAPAAATPVPPTDVPAPPGSTPTPDVQGVRRGGELRAVTNISRLVDPAEGSLVEYNVWWYVTEMLTIITHDNITIPWLLEKWTPSEDLKTWTLHCRKGIKFNHGPEFTADDVVFNLNRWLAPTSKSSIKGLMSPYLDQTGIEKVDQYTVRLNLKKAQIAVPEHLFHNPAAILPKDWDGDWVKQPYGTGPFTLEEYVVQERAVLKRREGYWRNGVDGKPLPYLDGIRLVHLGTDPAPAIAALKSGELDVIGMSPPLLDTIKDVKGVRVSSHTSAFCYVIRMRADKAPFSDVRVRNAIKICQDHDQMLEATMRGYGAPGEDFHVSPVHPEYTPMPPRKRDTDKAKALLAEAGFPNGISLKLAFPEGLQTNTTAQLLAAQCLPAGIKIELQPMPTSMYFEQWTDLDFGITSWAHRPLASMVLSLAYRKGGVWNETHWDDPEFESLLDQVESTYDLNKRKEFMAKIQKIQQDRGTIGVPNWNSLIIAISNRVRNVRAAVHDHSFYHEAWIDPNFKA